MQRRQFVHSVGAGSALVSLGLASGCASVGGGKGPKVVVVLAPRSMYAMV